MGEVTFERRTLTPELCEYLDCPRNARYEFGLIGSPVHYVDVCARHQRWAKNDLIARTIEREERLRSQPASPGGQADGER